MGSTPDGKIAKSFDEHTNQANAPKMSSTVPLDKIDVTEPPLLKENESLKEGIETLKTTREDLEAAKKHKEELMSTLQTEYAAVDAVVAEATKKAQAAKQTLEAEVRGAITKTNAEKRAPAPTPAARAEKESAVATIGKAVEAAIEEIKETTAAVKAVVKPVVTAPVKATEKVAAPTKSVMKVDEPAAKLDPSAAVGVTAPTVVPPKPPVAPPLAAKAPAPKPPTAPSAPPPAAKAPAPASVSEPVVDKVALTNAANILKAQLQLDFQVNKDVSFCAARYEEGLAVCMFRPNEETCPVTFDRDRCRLVDTADMSFQSPSLPKRKMMW